MDAWLNRSDAPVDFVVQILKAGTGKEARNRMEHLIGLDFDASFLGLEANWSGQRSEDDCRFEPLLHHFLPVSIHGFSFITLRPIKPITTSCERLSSVTFLSSTPGRSFQP